MSGDDVPKHTCDTWIRSGKACAPYLCPVCGKDAVDVSWLLMSDVKIPTKCPPDKTEGEIKEAI